MSECSFFILKTICFLDGRVDDVITQSTSAGPCVRASEHGIEDKATTTTIDDEKKKKEFLDFFYLGREDDTHTYAEPIRRRMK